MADQKNKSSQELVAELERRTKLLGIGKVALLVVVIIGLAWLIASNYKLQTENSNLQTQNAQLLSQQKKTLDSLSKNAAASTKQINELQNHIDCIVDLFAQPNRANLTISDISTCKLTTTASATVPVSSTSSPPKTSQATAPAPQSQQVRPQSSSWPSQAASLPSSPSTPAQKPGLVKQILKFLGL